MMRPAAHVHSVEDVRRVVKRVLPVIRMAAGGSLRFPAGDHALARMRSRRVIRRWGLPVRLQTTREKPQINCRSPIAAPTMMQKSVSGAP